MKKICRLIHSQQGGAMLAALMVFLVLSVLGAAIISVAGMESKMALNDARAEQARQAADSGVQIARDVLMNYLGAGKSIPAIADIGLNEICLGGNSYAEIKSIALTNGMATIESEGKVKSGGKVVASKTAQASIFISGLPDYPLRSNRIRVLGKYIPTISNSESEFTFDITNWKFAKQQNWPNPSAAIDTLLSLDLLTNPFITKYPLNGLAYSELTDTNHPHWVPGNSNNLKPNTWWVNYEYNKVLGTKVSHDLHDSVLTVAPYYYPKGQLDVFQKKDGHIEEAEIAIHDGWWDEIDDENMTAKEISDLNDKVFSLKEGKFVKTEIARPKPGENAALYALWPKLKNENDANIIEPPAIPHSKDFIKSGKDINDVVPPQFAEEQLNIYKTLALAGAPGWQYIDGSPLLRPFTKEGKQYYKLIVDDPGLTANKIFINLPPSETVVIDFTTVTHNVDPIFSWDLANVSSIINKVKNDLGTFFNRYQNNLASITVVSPASLEVGYDSFMFQGAPGAADEKPHIFLLSGSNIDLYIDPSMFNGIARFWDNAGALRNLRTFILAGEDVRITSTPEEVTFEGIISAGQDLTFMMDYFYIPTEDILKKLFTNPVLIADLVPYLLSNGEIEKTINVIKDESIIDEFPEPWAYIGVAPIVSYKYIK